MFRDPVLAESSFLFTFVAAFVTLLLCCDFQELFLFLSFGVELMTLLSSMKEELRFSLNALFSYAFSSYVVDKPRSLAPSLGILFFFISSMLDANA